MKLSAVSDIPVWTWIAIAAVVLAAVIVIVCIVIWAIKKSKADHSGNGAPAEKKAESSRVKETPSTQESSAKQEKPAKAVKPAEEKPAKAEKPAEKNEEKPAKPAPVKEEKPAGKVYHISKRREDNKWQIKAEGGARAIKLFLTQKEAIEYAKTLADNQDARIMIHKEDGSFRKLTY